LEKAIEIKRRAQRCIQKGDLDGALSEYQKLTGSEDSDPYNFVLIADLHYKKGATGEASQSYLAGVGAYERAGLYKNAIAICKKMMRLSLSAPIVLQRLAQLHALDGLGTEAALFYMQYAEHLTREERFIDAVDTLRKAFEACPDTTTTLERLAEVQLLADDVPGAVATLLDAAVRYRSTGQPAAAARVRDRAEQLRPGAAEQFEGMPDPLPPSIAGDVSLVSHAPPEARPAFTLASDLSDLVPTADSEVFAPETPATEDWFTTNASGVGVAPNGPGLRFEGAGEDAAPGTEMDSPVTGVETLLREAEDHLRAGDHEAASAALVRAARSYDDVGRFDSSAAIYRSLGKSAQATTAVLELWLANCEARREGSEAAEVACSLGDRAMNDGHAAEARTWFERALSFAPGNELATRRLQRLASGAAGAETAGEPSPATNGKVEVALGRAQAVTLDLGSLIAEFQRGVEAQLSGDAQSHYDLGVTYREMGLLEQAVDSFRVAARDGAYAGRCAEMIGRSLLDQGRFDEAAVEFVGALERPEISSDAAVNLRFHLGLAYEAAGRSSEALAEFERVYAAHANYPDVALKIRGLRRTPESV
jgi:tetratricopeptide (TPR) repeat protein